MAISLRFYPRPQAQFFQHTNLPPRKWHIYLPEIANVIWSSRISLLISFVCLQVLECEFFLLEMMDCCLIVYHPYRPLTQYVADLGMEDAILPIAWRILNDSLRTDVSLIYPPYQIALAAIYMACVIQQKDSKQWFAELSVDMDKVLEITQEILQLYELYKSYDERAEISAVLSRAPRPKVRPTSATPGQTPSPVPPESWLRTLWLSFSPFQ